MQKPLQKPNCSQPTAVTVIKIKRVSRTKTMSGTLPQYPPNFSGKIKIFRNQQLGKGSSGMVFGGTYEGTEVAVKRIEHHQIDSREVEMQTQLRHVNVVNILTVEDDDDFR